jgi:4-alpha-glucanotransferase
LRHNSNHRYDTADYKKIDPLLGTEEDFIELCRAAKEKGIQIILDGVFNHTGSDSVYFNKQGRYYETGAFQSKDSPYSKWFRFIEYPEKYESWWGNDTLPSVNETEPSFLDYMIRSEDSVVKHWLRCGASGFRLDVADELPDEFLEALRSAVKEVNPDAAVIGEVWEDASNKIAYGSRRKYFLGKQLIRS